MVGSPPSDPESRGGDAIGEIKTPGELSDCDLPVSFALDPDRVDDDSEDRRPVLLHHVLGNEVLVRYEYARSNCDWLNTTERNGLLYEVPSEAIGWSEKNTTIYTTLGEILAADEGPGRCCVELLQRLRPSVDKKSDKSVELQAGCQLVIATDPSFPLQGSGVKAVRCWERGHTDRCTLNQIVPSRRMSRQASHCERGEAPAVQRGLSAAIADEGRLCSDVQHPSSVLR